MTFKYLQSKTIKNMKLRIQLPILPIGNKLAYRTIDTRNNNIVLYETELSKFREITETEFYKGKL